MSVTVDPAFCAGRRAVAHERTEMEPVGTGWLCPVCGEFVDDRWNMHGSRGCDCGAGMPCKDGR